MFQQAQYYYFKYYMQNRMFNECIYASKMRKEENLRYTQQRRRDASVVSHRSYVRRIQLHRVTLLD